MNASLKNRLNKLEHRHGGDGISIIITQENDGVLQAVMLRDDQGRVTRPAPDSQEAREALANRRPGTLLIVDDIPRVTVWIPDNGRNPHLVDA
jgi:hypothetical protein